MQFLALILLLFVSLPISDSEQQQGGHYPAPVTCRLGTAPVTCQQRKTWTTTLQINMPGLSWKCQTTGGHQKPISSAWGLHQWLFVPYFTNQCSQFDYYCDYCEAWNAIWFGIEWAKQASNQHLDCGRDSCQALQQPLHSSASAHPCAGSWAHNEPLELQEPPDRGVLYRCVPWGTL